MATYVDINPSSTNFKGFLVFDKDAIIAALRNLFSCPVGNRGRIFQPEFGSYLYDLLQEPVDGTTSIAIRASLIETIRRWEPRISIQALSIDPNYRLPGYDIRIEYLLRGLSQTQNIALSVAQGGN